MECTSGVKTEEKVYVEHINQTDVVLGRGAHSYFRLGNLAFRHIIWALRTQYQSTRSPKKHDVGRRVVEEIHRLGGRFLCQDSKTLKYFIVSDELATRKACDALRSKKMEKPVGFDPKGMKAKSTFIKSIEHAILHKGIGKTAETPPVVTVASRNFRVSGMFSDTLISALSGPFSDASSQVLNPTDVPYDLVSSDSNVMKHTKIKGSNEQVFSAQALSPTVTSLDSKATHFSSQCYRLAESNRKETQAVMHNDMLRSLIPDPFTSHGEGRRAPNKLRMDDITLCLPAHIKSFFNGLLERYILDQESDDEKDWINIVNQTTLDFNDTDDLWNEELSVFTPKTWMDMEWSTAQQPRNVMQPISRVEESSVLRKSSSIFIVNTQSSEALEPVLSLNISAKNRGWGEKGQHFNNL